jgi:TolA-binding protein
MKNLTGLLMALLLACPAQAGFFDKKPPPATSQEQEQLFETGSGLYRESTRDKMAAIESYERFVRRFPHSRRAPDAQFMIGEAHLNQALKILRKEAEAKKNSPNRLLAPRNAAAVTALNRAKDAYEKVLGRYRKAESGLNASAQYRLGEVAYNEKDWGRAIEEWRKVEENHQKSYLVAESWMGIIFANLALEQFSQAEANLFLLGETFPHYLKVPEVLYVQGIISLHKGDYANAERALKRVNTPEAQFYLGKTYLLSKRPYRAASAFEKLVRSWPDSVLREETEFFIGDSFFLAKDFKGAITKYERFQAKYPDSQLRVSALFRLGSAQFQQGDLVEARARFQSVIDRYPRDFFAPLAQYFIAESYLIEDQFRESLFAYTKVITQYPETIKISPLAHYKLAWSQFQVGDFGQAAQTCRNFLSLYPTHALAKNVYIILGNALMSQKRYDDAVTAFQRIIDLAPTSDAAEQALFSILQTQYKLKAYNSILTSYQFIFRHLPPSQSKWRPMSYVYAADAYLALNRVDEAKAIFEMLLKVYPNDPAAFYAQDGLAWTYAFMGDDDRALDERKKLSEMMRLAKSSFTFSGTNQLGIADSMYNRKEYDDAYQLYQKFQQDSPKHARAAQALYRAGMSLYHLRYYTQAIEAWSKLVAQYPKAKETERARFQMADTLFRAQKYDEAIVSYKDIIAKYPRSKQIALAYLRVAMSAYNAKDDAGTLNGALQLLSKYPKAPEATDALDLMEAVYDRNPKSNFWISLGKVVAAVPGTLTAGDAQFRIGRRLYEINRYEDAAKEFQKFSVDYTSSKKLEKAQFLLGESYFNAKKYPDAVLAFERFHENFPRNENTALALFHLGSSHYQLKQYTPAIKHYLHLLDEYATSDYAKAAQFNLALAFKATGNLERAEEAYSRFASMEELGSTGNKSALWELFAIQKDRKDTGGAMSTLNRINDSKPTDEERLEIVFRKGEVYQLMGQLDEALRTWEELVAMKPRANAFRLQGLIQLGDAYEKDDRKEYAKAIRVYNDLAKHAGKDVAAAARQRATALKQMQGGGEGYRPGGSRKTQVMPKAPKKKSRKSKKKAPKKDKNGKDIVIPGMN